MIVPNKPLDVAAPPHAVPDAELELLQRESFSYFLHETNPDNGLVIDKTAANWPASIAAVGLALATYPVKSGNPFGWVSPWHFGLNLGPIILMIENYRSDLLWRLMRECAYITAGLRRAGFGGG
jgi:hypothetical protein